VGGLTSRTWPVTSQSNSICGGRPSVVLPWVVRGGRAGS
jgi:hypothetical protein